MPNTNHRTGIGLLDRYLTSMDDDFVMPDTGEEGQWYSWAVDFILDSKRLLTLRRNLATLRWAHHHGYRTVKRKEGVTIDLEGVELDRSNHFEYYTKEHQKRTREFVDTLLSVADSQGLQEQIDDGKQSFVNRLRTDQ